MMQVQNPDTQIYGMLTKHALTCIHCGADLTKDVEFQRFHMLKEHGLEA